MDLPSAVALTAFVIASIDNGAAAARSLLYKHIRGCMIKKAMTNHMIMQSKFFNNISTLIFSNQIRVKCRQIGLNLSTFASRMSLNF
jgi:hypothetical protein